MKKVTEQVIESILAQGVRDMPTNPASQGYNERQIRGFYYIPEKKILMLMSQVEDANEEQLKEFKTVGDWDAEKEYKAFNIVRFEGASYMAIQTVPMGISPTDEEYWNMLAIDGVNTEIDETLTQQGQAADAKVVGDALEGKIAKPDTPATDTLLQHKTDGTIANIEVGGSIARAKVGNIPCYVKNAEVGDVMPAGYIYTNTPKQKAHAANKQYVDETFNGANKAVSFVNYSSMITSLNALGNTAYGVGQNVMIVTLNVPDLWVSEVLEESVQYTYVSDEDLVNELAQNGSVRVGYYVLSALETQKVDLTDYAKTEDVENGLNGKLDVPTTTASTNYYRVIGYRNNSTTLEELPAFATSQDGNSGALVRYNSNSRLVSGTPTTDVEVANKKYVDDAIANLGGSSSGSAPVRLVRVSFYEIVDEETDLYLNGELCFYSTKTLNSIREVCELFESYNGSCAYQSFPAWYTGEGGEQNSVMTFPDSDDGESGARFILPEGDISLSLLEANEDKISIEYFDI